MFCYQCQEAANNTGCTLQGICGKEGKVADLQDLLVYVLKGISLYNIEARKKGVNLESTSDFITKSIFATITNANFDKEYFRKQIRAALKLRDTLKADLMAKKIDVSKINHDCTTWFADSDDDFAHKSVSVGVQSTKDADIRSLRELLTYGLKGMCAYADHAYVLGYKDDKVFAFIEKALCATIDDSLDLNAMVALVMECGSMGVETLAMLDKANTETYGNPEVSEVELGVRGNPAILVSGHDLKDLEVLLEQTKGSGVDVYTHSEMLPAHYYPAFKKYDNFVGNYGSSWWNQKEDFDSFNGPVLMTTNCVVPPKESYKARVYTTNSVGYPGMIHIPEDKNGKKDYSAIIEHAKKCAPPTEIETGKIVGGFAHNTVLSLADKVVEAVKTGAIKRFFVMAGCDGRMKSREYYTEFAKALPKDTIILTAGCAKYRYNKLDLGDINGIPRVLDAGQCNDSYSLAVIALKLKEVFGLNDVNELPISYNIAWYEQKAVIVLLALLSLGVKNIHLGPTLPAFLSENVVNLLVENFGIAGIGEVESDVKMFMEA